MNFENLKSTASLALLSISGTFVGCASMPQEISVPLPSFSSKSDAIPNYPTATPQTSTVNALVDTNGILRNPDGSVVPVFGNPCQQLAKLQGSVGPNNAQQRITGRTVNGILNAPKTKEPLRNAGEAVLAGGLAKIIQGGSDAADRTMAEASINTLTGQCAQATAHKQFQDAFRQCTLTATRNAPRGTQVDLTQVPGYCRQVAAQGQAAMPAYQMPGQSPAYQPQGQPTAGATSGYRVGEYMAIDTLTVDGTVYPIVQGSNNTVCAAEKGQAGTGPNLGIQFVPVQPLGGGNYRIIAPASGRCGGPR